jgi:Clp amino terminal domain, pathogenicity island component
VPIDDDATPLRPTPRYRNVLQHAENQARRHGHPYIGIEHLMLGILDDGLSVATAAVAKFVDLETVRTELERILASESYAKGDPGSSARPRTDDERSDSVPVALVRGDERQQAMIHWRWTARGPGDVYQAQLEWTGSSVEVGANDMFEALVRIRERLEPHGWFIAVQGSRLDTFPSGMQRDMAGGLSLYVMRIGEPARDVVKTFDEADPSTLATVAAQRQHVEKWARSLQGLAGSDR